MDRKQYLKLVDILNEYSLRILNNNHSKLEALDDIEKLFFTNTCNSKVEDNDLFSKVEDANVHYDLGDRI